MISSIFPRAPHALAARLDRLGGVLGTHNLPEFLVTVFVLIVVPGPSVLFVVGRALALGRRAALLTVVGNAMGLALQVAMVALGVGAVVAESSAVFTTIKLLGAAYLVLLGIRAFRDRHALAAAVDAAVAPRSGRRIVREGFLVGATNPKGVIIFTAVLPQFVDRTAGHVPLQLGFLGAISVAIALVSDGAWALASGSARAWLGRNPRRLRLVGGASGFVMIGLGLRLAFSGRND
jgi:threonine/homoserine/homoserine lactone efflux protein